MFYLNVEILHHEYLVLTTALYKLFPYRFTDILSPDLCVITTLSSHYQRFPSRLMFRRNDWSVVTIILKIGNRSIKVAFNSVWFSTKIYAIKEFFFLKYDSRIFGANLLFFSFENWHKKISFKLLKLKKRIWYIYTCEMRYYLYTRKHLNPIFLMKNNLFFQLRIPNFKRLFITEHFFLKNSDI